ncbi:hypothetical protein K457DRAFT_22662 [Linnemannia elongata AG-77]|uniref:Uncharacterized protein n=1 Tax=Linnemannia elongata AG-77 TaxID=1314771 RepID=A0A197JLJ8_9FUNG|nr:hypothetical protein K457DRAFT_22662 [Linnemannia elongata AG-77]
MSQNVVLLSNICCGMVSPQGVIQVQPILNGLHMAGCGGLSSAYPMSESKIPKKLNAWLNAILAEEWGFLENPWPLYPTTRKFHRSELKPINNMHHMKEEVIGKIGAIGDSMEAMSVFLPRSSLYEIHRTFFKTEKRLFEKEMMRCFANMFSTPEIRMRSAAWSNPQMFRHGSHPGPV